MRVLFVTNMYPPHHFGGYELSCRDAIRHFARTGHAVTLLTSTIKVDGVEDSDTERSLEVHRTLEPYWRDHELLSPPLPRRLAIERHNQRVLLEVLDAFKPDVVSVWNMGALSLGLLDTIRARSLPTVFVVGDNWPCYAPELDAWTRLFTGRLGRVLAGTVRAVTGLPTKTKDFSTMGACVFNSRSTRNAVEEHSGWSLPRSGIVYCGVDTGDFPVRDENEPLDEREWGWRLLYVGRIDERKGIETAILALPHLPEATLRVVGRGDDTYLAYLHRLAARTGVTDRVVFGVAERAELVAEYGSMDVLIFPSVYDEPFGIVPLEGMACDVPVVATARGGSGEYLKDGVNCLVFEASEARDLAGVVIRLAEDRALRRRLVRGGRRTARALTTTGWITSLLDWHKAAVAGFADGQPPDRQPPDLWPPLQQQGALP